MKTFVKVKERQTDRQTPTWKEEEEENKIREQAKEF